MKLDLNFLKGILLDFVIILTCYFALQLMSSIYNSFNNLNNNTPYSFSLIWIGLIFLIPLLYFKKRGLQLFKFIGLIFVILIIGGISIAATMMLYNICFKDYPLEIIESNFIGVSGIDESAYEHMYYEGTNSKITNGYVFSKGDLRINMELKRIEEEHELSSQIRYVFWQSALADGFDPKFLSEFNCCNSLKERTMLYFSVGPIRIVEAVIDALPLTLLNLIVPIILRLRGKYLFFSNFENLKNYMKIEMTSK